MHGSRALALLAAVTAISGAAATSAQAAAWLTVDRSSLCGSDGCFGNNNTFTKTFSAAGQSGVVDVGSLAVLRDIMGTSNYSVKVTFQLADGSEVSWGRFTLAAMGGDVVTLSGETVAWNTSLGDLTVKLEQIVPRKGVGGGGGFGGGGGGGGGGYLAGGGPAGFDLEGGGPLVRPAVPNPGALAVPEPGAWALMILGFGSAGAMLRRSRARYFKFG